MPIPERTPARTALVQEYIRLKEELLSLQGPVLAKRFDVSFWILGQVAKSPPVDKLPASLTPAVAQQIRFLLDRRADLESRSRFDDLRRALGVGKENVRLWVRQVQADMAHSGQIDADNQINRFAPLAQRRTELSGSVNAWMTRPLVKELAL